MKTDRFSKIMLLIIMLCLLFLVAHVVVFDTALIKGMRSFKKLCSSPAGGEIFLKINRILKEK